MRRQLQQFLAPLACSAAKWTPSGSHLGRCLCMVSAALGCRSGCAITWACDESSDVVTSPHGMLPVLCPTTCPQYYQVPRLWLVGYDESRRPLSPQQVLLLLSAACCLAPQCWHVLSTGNRWLGRCSMAHGRTTVHATRGMAATGAACTNDDNEASCTGFQQYQQHKHRHTAMAWKWSCLVPMPTLMPIGAGGCE